MTRVRGLYLETLFIFTRRTGDNNSFLGGRSSHAAPENNSFFGGKSLIYEMVCYRPQEPLNYFSST